METLRKTFLFMIAAALSLQLTSCLDDDDNDSENLSDSDYATYLSNMTGRYTGYIYYWNDTIDDDGATDSTYVSPYVYGSSDSLITVSVPGSILAKEIEDDDIREAINDNMGDVDLEMKFYLYYAISSYVFFGVYPETASASFTTSDGESHTAKFTFYTYSNYNGWYGSRTLRALFYLTRIDVDGDAVKEFTIGINTTDDNAAYEIQATKYY